MIEIKDISKRYKNTLALNHVTLTIETNKIVGLIGANGAGKSTLMKIIAGQVNPSSGSLTDIKSPYSNICLMSDYEKVLENYSLKEVLSYMPDYYKDFDQILAIRLIEEFQVNTKKKYSKLSKGQRGIINMILAIASRAEITLLDETYISLDAPSRHKMMELILNDYHERPRTYIISTHYIDEITKIFDHIIVLDKGQVLISDDKDHVESKCLTVFGHEEIGDKLLKDITIINKEVIGKRAIYSIFDDISNLEPLLRQQDFEITMTPLEKWFIQYIDSKGVDHVS